MYNISGFKSKTQFTPSPIKENKEFNNISFKIKIGLLEVYIFKKLIGLNKRKKKNSFNDENDFD